ncbi:MAG: carbon-nitrogen hydrolase family protein [Candidatus Phaeomarinobacter sp.]
MTETDQVTTRVAAVQMEARVADIPYNIDHAARLIDEAVSKGAEIIAIPEFFTTRIVYDERLFGCSLPPQNPALDMLVSKATLNNVMIGGSYLEMRDGDVYNTYVLVEPDGTVHRHDKDLPTMVENAFYVGGNDDGCIETAKGRIGAAVCWEMVRTQTPKRLIGKVDLLMTGSHWWSDPGWWVFKPIAESFHAGNGRMMHRTPGRLAAMIGAPILHAGHTGILEGGYLMVPGTRWNIGTRTQLMGDTQIVDGAGDLVAWRHYADGAGVITADIELGRTETREDIPDRFWIQRLSRLTNFIWHHQNACGKSAYQWAKRTGRLQTYDFTSIMPPAALTKRNDKVLTP